MVSPVYTRPHILLEDPTLIKTLDYAAMAELSVRSRCHFTGSRIHGNVVLG